MLKRLICVVILGVGGFFGPLVGLHLTTDIRTLDQAAPADAALIFGAIVRNGTISPLHKERLDAAITLWNDGKVGTLVVSNSMRAANSMRDYLMLQGIPANVIERDGRAERTPQTCTREVDRNPKRSLIFISQTFHLPRVYFQCRVQGINGQLITATPSSRPPAPLLTKIRVRTGRHFREAGLLWGAIVGIYPQ